MTAEMSVWYDEATDEWVVHDLDLGGEFRHADFLTVLDVAERQGVRYFYPDGDGRLRGYIIPRRPGGAR